MRFRFKLPARFSMTTELTRSTRDLSKLYDYQQEGVWFLVEHDRALLADEPGLGKSAQVLRALPPRARTILLCPAFLVPTWEEQAALWRPDLRVVSGKLTMPWTSEIVLFSYDSLPALEEIDENLADVHLVCDEAHKLKGLDTLRGERARRLCDACEKIWLLTGTPIVNKSEELEALRMIGGKREMSMLRRLRKNVLPDLPPKKSEIVYVNGPKDLLNEAKLLNAKWDYQARKHPPFAEIAELRAKLAAARIPAMLKMLDKIKEPCLVFAAHLEPLRALEGRAGWAFLTGETSVEERRLNVNRFQAGELAGLGCSIGASGLGITLTRARRALYVSHSYSAAENRQTEDRIWRIGQTRDVLITHLVTDCTLERRLFEILVNKTDAEREILGLSG